MLHGGQGRPDHHPDHHGAVRRRRGRGHLHARGHRLVGPGRGHHLDASASTVCSITAGAVSYQATGTCKVDFNQAGTPTTTPRPRSSRPSRWARAPRPSPRPPRPRPAQPSAGPTYTPTATASSGLAVAITIDAGVRPRCARSPPGSASFTSTGTCTIDFNQVGQRQLQRRPAGPADHRRGAPSRSPSRSPRRHRRPPSAVPAYTVTATGGASGNPVTFSVDGFVDGGCVFHRRCGRQLHRGGQLHRRRQPGR